MEKEEFDGWVMSVGPRTAGPDRVAGAIINNCIATASPPMSLAPHHPIPIPHHAELLHLIQ